MKTSGPWFSADIQARIEPPMIPPIKEELEEYKPSNIIKVKIREKTSQAAS